LGILDALGIGKKREQPPELPSPEWEGGGMGASAQEGPMGAQMPRDDPYATASAKEMIDFVEKEFERRQKERVPFELQWRLNIAFMEGNQYVQINEVAQTLDRVPEEFWWEEREVFNHIAPNIEARQARLGKMRPVLKARAGSSEKSDIRATKVSTQLLSSIQHDQKIRDKLHEVIRWLEVTGTVCIKSIWNPDAGPLVPQIDPETGEPMINPETGQPVLMREGDLEVVVCPAPEIFPDSPFSQKIADNRSIIHAKIYPVDTIKEIWGVSVTPEETKAVRLQALMTGGGFIGKTYSTGMNESLKKAAIVKEYHERPSKKYPQGRQIVVANHQLLYFGPLPYRIDKDGELGLPFTKMSCVERPGLFWGRTIIERLIPIQRRYNALRNRKAEYLAACAVGGWVIEENSVDLSDLEANGGSRNYICQYRAGTQPPRRADNAPLPPAFETEEQTLLTEFSILSGVSEMSRQSMAPPGVKSGVAMSLALEQDETRLADTANNIEEGLIECGSQWLRLLKQFVKMPRLVRVAGKDNVVDVLDWTASDLKPEDVIMDSFSALSESPTQRRQMVFDLLGMGLFHNPDTGAIDRPARTRIMEMLQFLDWEGVDDDDQLHSAKAERENRQLASGAPVMPVHYDSHFLHIKRHNEFRLSTEYEALITQMPQVEQVFEAHVMTHMQALAPLMTQQEEEEPQEQK